MYEQQASWALLTDLYELTMAQGYWVEGIADREAVFHLYARRAPYGGQAMIAAGIGTALDWLEAFAMDASDLAYLASIPSADGTPLLRADFIEWLGEQRFQCDIDVVAEGELVAPPAPLLRVKGPLWQAQVIESALLSAINFQSLIATSAARTVSAAKGGQVLEFGLRRAQGFDGAMSASRAAYVGGVHGTSNVLAGKRWGIPVKGTHAHSWVMAFGSELDAFRAYANALPDPTILLVDTWDTLDGVRNAITIGREMEAQGRKLAGIRLDSGDLAQLAKDARALLDAAGMDYVQIVASNDLHEARVRELLEADAPITLWGVGTQLVTGGSQSSLGGVYKLSALADAQGTFKHLVKRSEEHVKASYPGVLQVWRTTDLDGRPVDVMTDELLSEGLRQTCRDMSGASATVSLEAPSPLLIPAFREGRRVLAAESLDEARDRAIERWTRFEKEPPKPLLDAGLWALRERMLADNVQSKFS